MMMIMKKENNEYFDKSITVILIMMISMGSVERALRVSISHLTARGRGELINYQCCHQCHCHHHQQLKGFLFLKGHYCYKNQNFVNIFVNIKYI